MRIPRVLRVLLVIGVVLAGLLVGADRFAENWAEGRIEEQVRLDRGARAGDIEVDIAGFPFLTQAVSDRLDRVDAVLSGVETRSSSGRPVRITRIDARFHDVRLDDGWSGGTASRVDGEMFLSYEDLTRAAPLGVTVGYGGAPGTVKVTASIGIFGRSLSRSVVSKVTLLDGSSVRVRAAEVPGEGFPGLAGLIRSKTDFDRRIEGLPTGLRLTGVTTSADGVRATLAGRDVLLGD
ncbi:DUF2993 domain-containing protein [Streptomyces sp. 12297]|uniref:LmeA family phospholipid-binding protein n=1 Tax=Streptomyces sp. NBC_00239 TaxID=2903640 RepID=UPI002E2D66A8|nr:DUF2993 domain-containing protein [Streptomyces sp. NBC_00239]